MKMLMSPPNVAAPILVTHDSSARFEIQVRAHRLVVDQTIRGGGEDAGPEPIELLGAALGSCIAHYVKQFCRIRSLESEGLVVTVDQRLADSPRRVGTFVVGVWLPSSFPEYYTETIERVARSCPVHNTLVRGADIEVTVTRDV